MAGKLFKQLQDAATVQNVWNDPQLRAQMPGVVATINGEQIPYSELAEECLLRYGEEVLEVEISHLLLKQALAKANVAVTDQDLNDEIGPRRQTGRRRRQRRQARHGQMDQSCHRRAGRHEGPVHARFGLALGRAQEAHGRHDSS